MNSEAVPRVSVFMTTFNGAGLLRESIGSILAQSFSDFELVVVDDCSTDETQAILADCDDPRLRIYRTPRNLGVAGARNFGVSRLRGAYIAALDHDDLSAPERLAIQVTHLDANPNVVLVGSAIHVTENGVLRRDDDHACPTPILARWMLHVDNPLTWSSVMLRASAIDRLGVFVRPEFEFADDFDLYHRLVALGDIVRLEVPLTTYRHHAGNTSHAQREKLTNAAAAVLARVYEPWFGASTAEAAALGARHLAGRESVGDTATLNRLGAVLERVLAGFCTDYAPDPATRARIEAIAARLWWRHARGTIRAGNPLAIRGHRARPRLRCGFKPAAHDLVESLALGTLRSNALARRMLGPLRR